MTDKNGSDQENTPPQTMSLVIDRNLSIVWADPAALAYFGTTIIHQPCHKALYQCQEPCAHCIVRDCFDDRQPHIEERKVRIKGECNRLLRRTAIPADFRANGHLQFVKEIIEDVTPHMIFDKTMSAIQAKVMTDNRQLFFKTLVVKLCKIFKAHMFFVGAFSPDQAQIQSIATAVKGKLNANFDYPLFHAPCRHLIGKPWYAVLSGVAELYPQCHWLKENKIHAYVAVQLRDSHDRPFGLMAVAFQKDIKDLQLLQTLIKLFSRPVAAALERLANQRILDKYRHIAATSNDQLALIGQNFIYQVVNRAYAAYHDQTPEQIVGRAMSDVVGEGFFNTTIRPAAEKCLLGHQSRLQIWHPSDDLTRRCLEMAFYPHYEKGANRIKGFILCAKDITSRKNMEANLRQAAKMEAIGRLAGGIVHDFNNILGAVIGYTDLALSVVKDQPDVTQYLKEIQQAGLRATELAKQILAFSRQNQEIRRPIQPAAILKEALSLLRSTIPADIAIRADLESKTCILADPTHLHQIVINLCTNAQHAMQKHGGTLSVQLEDVVLGPAELIKQSAMQPGPYVRISFTDTGHGISPDVQSKMFDPFFTTKGKSQGTGMGLTMVNSIVKSYHGMIDLKSEVGRGTTIQIYLPVIETKREPERIEQTQLPQGKGQRILVVDDERNLAEVTGTMLKSLGYAVQTETDSQSALRLFELNPKAFDLMLIDVAMPKMAGDKLAQQVLTMRPGLPVILVTGHSDRVNQNNIRKIGVQKLLAKPLPLSQLATAVREALDNVV